MPVKPIKELLLGDVKELMAEELQEYEKFTNDEVMADKEKIRLCYEKHHQLCLQAKKHEVGYQQFQVGAYQAKKELETHKKDIVRLNSEFISLRREWERLHDANKVGVWMADRRGNAHPVLP